MDGAETGMVEYGIEMAVGLGISSRLGPILMATGLVAREVE